MCIIHLFNNSIIHIFYRTQVLLTAQEKSVSAINVQPNLPSLTYCPQIIPFYDASFFKYKNYFQGFFPPDDYSLDITTLQQQQSQDPVLRIVYSWIIKNEKPETLTPLTYHWHFFSTCLLQTICTTFYR